MGVYLVSNSARMVLTRREVTPTPTLSTLLRKCPVLQTADFVLTRDPKSPYEGQFCGRPTGRCSGMARVRLADLNRSQWTSSGQNAPKWTILVRFNAKIQFDQNGRLDHFGPARFPTVPRPFPRCLEVKGRNRPLAKRAIILVRLKVWEWGSLPLFQVTLRKRRVVQKSMGHKVPWKIGVQIHLL